MSDFTSKKYVPAPITTRAPGAPRYVPAPITTRAPGAPRYVPAASRQAVPAGEIALTAESFSAIERAPDLISSQTLNNIVFPKFFQGFNKNGTSITFNYQFIDKSGADALVGSFTFRAPNSTNNPVVVPVRLSKTLNYYSITIANLKSYQLYAPSFIPANDARYPNQTATYTILEPVAPLSAECDRATSLPSDYFRDVQLDVPQGAILPTNITILLNGVNICNNQSAATWAHKYLITDNIINPYVWRTYFSTQYSATTKPICNAIVNLIWGEFGNAWHPKYTRDEYVPNPGPNPRADIWQRWRRNPQLPFMDAPNDWCTTFTCWAIWKVYGCPKRAPVPDCNDMVTYFNNAGAFLSPMPRYRYRGATTSVADLAKVRTGFWAHVGDSTHATFFIKWVKSPTDWTETTSQEQTNWTYHINSGDSSNIGLGIQIPSKFFLAIGGNQGGLVKPDIFPVYVPHPAQVQATTTLMWKKEIPKGIIWDPTVQSANRGTPIYGDGFGDPTMF